MSTNIHYPGEVFISAKRALKGDRTDSTASSFRRAIPRCSPISTTMSLPPHSSQEDVDEASEHGSSVRSSSWIRVNDARHRQEAVERGPSTGGYSRWESYSLFFPPERSQGYGSRWSFSRWSARRKRSSSGGAQLAHQHYSQAVTGVEYH